MQELELLLVTLRRSLKNFKDKSEGELMDEAVLELLSTPPGAPKRRETPEKLR